MCVSVCTYPHMHKYTRRKERITRKRFQKSLKKKGIKLLEVWLLIQPKQGS